MAQAMTDRVRQHTSSKVLARIDSDTCRNVRAGAGNGRAIEARLSALGREWDTDRMVELEAALVGLTGLLLGTRRNPALLGVTLAAGSAVLAHAVTGWYPWLPVFRRLGLRSAREISRERMALKAVRGDFDAARNGANGLAGPASRAGTDGTGIDAHGVSPTNSRVQRHTPQQVNARIRSETDQRVAAMADAPAEMLTARITRLEREWDVERVLQANASTLVVAGTLLGLTVSRRFLLLPLAVLSFFGQHAVQGWCPPLPVLRRLGVRTVSEIEREQHALKVLRGDYAQVASQPDLDGRVRAALAAVDR